MLSRSSQTARFIADCIAAGRTPTRDEEAALAARIWTEIARDRTMRMWSHLAPAAWDRLMAFRAAKVALQGLG